MPSSQIGPAWLEADRLAALASYAILDTSPEQAFDDVVILASKLLDAPIVAINLIDEGRQWFKSELGLGVREMPLDDSICKVAILQDDCMVVPDTRNDSRFDCNPLVTGEPGLRFYAGELLITPNGFPLGTLCVLDTKPRPNGLTDLQQLTLRTLAQQVLAQLELRKLIHEQQTMLAEKKQIETALRLEQARSRLATDAAELGLWSWDPIADEVTWDNSRPYDMLGLSHSDEPVNGERFIRDFIHEDDAQAFRAATAATIETGERFYFQGRIRRADKQLQWLEFFGNPQHAQDGALSRIIGVVSDITKRKSVELDLFDSRERFQTIVSQAATGVVEADSTGRITLVNERYCQMLGYAEAELVGKNFLHRTAPVSLQATLDVLQKLAAGTGGAVIEKQYRRKDGAIVWTSTSVSLLRGPLGQSRGIVAIVVDITETKRTEEDLRKLAANLSEADRRKSEFLATLAHELRNPLAPIRSGLGLIRRRLDNPEALEKICAMMERQVTQLVRLVDDLLDIARVNGGKVRLQKSHVTLISIMANAIETSMPVIDGKNHALTVTLPDESLVLDADPVRIAQVLANLLNNAAKYTRDGGHIAVTTHADEQEVVIVVTDNGVGIPQESLGSVFDMFNQIGESISQSQGGLGIGLSLVKRLVEMHGGTVTAASAGMGEGSTFSVKLPLVRATEKSAGVTLERPPLASSPSRHFRLLVADDNIDAAETFSTMLALSGHTIDVAHDGLDAVRMVRNFRPEVAFLDIGMPGMNGYEAARAIRSMPGLGPLILVALTGWGDESDRARARDAGFDHHLTKPVDFAAIEAMLSKFALEAPLTPKRD